MNERNGLLARLHRWLAGAQQPSLRQPVLLVVGPADPAAAGVAHLVQGRLREVPDGSGDAVAAALDEEVDAGCDLLVLAAPQVRPVASLVAVAAFSGDEPLSVVGFDARLPDQEWIRRMAATRDGVAAMERAQARADAEAVLDDPGLSATAVALELADARRVPVVLDGPGALAAALLAGRYGPFDGGRCLSAGADARAVVTSAHRILGLTGVLDLGRPTGDGVAGLLTLPLLRAAALLPG